MNKTKNKAKSDSINRYIDGCLNIDGYYLSTIPYTNPSRTKNSIVYKELTSS